MWYRNESEIEENIMYGISFQGKALCILKFVICCRKNLWLENVAYIMALLIVLWHLHLEKHPFRYTEAGKADRKITVKIFAAITHQITYRRDPLGCNFPLSNDSTKEMIVCHHEQCSFYLECNYRSWGIISILLRKIYTRKGINYYYVPV